MNGSKLPLSLRIISFLLRIALGLNFLYLGWGTLFDRTLGKSLAGQSLKSLYAWVGSSWDSAAVQTFSAWLFLIIGICLIAGFLTRLASIVGIGLTLASFVPNITFSPVNAYQFANDAVLVVLCFLVVIFANAGEYFGLDMFMHVHFFGKRK